MDCLERLLFFVIDFDLARLHKRANLNRFLPLGPRNETKPVTFQQALSAGLR